MVSHGVQACVCVGKESAGTFSVVTSGEETAGSLVVCVGTDVAGSLEVSVGSEIEEFCLVVSSGDEVSVCFCVVLGNGLGDEQQDTKRSVSARSARTVIKSLFAFFTTNPPVSIGHI